jgi:hypothetical protein
MSGGRWADFHPGQDRLGSVDALGRPIRRPYRAECTVRGCTWKGPVRFDPIAALNDGKEHDRQHPELALLPKAKKPPSFGG